MWWAARQEALSSAVRRVTTWRFRERVRGLMVRRGTAPPEAYEALQPLFAEDLARLRALVPGRQPAWLASA